MMRIRRVAEVRAESMHTGGTSREVRHQERMNSPLESREVRLRGLCTVGFFGVVLLLCVGRPLFAQVSEDEARATADAAISRIRSPYCPGLMLEVCPSSQAEGLRDSIRVMAAQGRSAEAIVEDVLARHGEEWRAVPKRSGAGLLAWLIMPLALVVGGLVLWGRVKVMRRQGPALATADTPMSDEERLRLAAALREFEQAEEGAA
jgi:cytochrome c-type biogenesis protein CcmH/NrfF